MEEHVLDLISAYVLGALEEDERSVVRAHLQRCATCRAELAANQELLGYLALSVPQKTPPPGLKQSILNQIQPRPAPQPSRASFTAALRSFFSTISPAYAIAGLILIIVLAVSNLLLWQQVRQLAQVKTPTPAFQLVNFKGTDQAPAATGVMVLAQENSYGTLIVDKLPALPKDKQYQLWLIRDGKRTSGGVFSVNNEGYGSLWISAPNPLNEYSQFGITIEPNGGSPGPTGAKVMGGTF